MNTGMQGETARDPVALEKAWQALKSEQPKLRIRDAATALGASEAELLATGCGTTVTRLKPEWPELINTLPSLGRCMALTRNAYAVHEKRGEYGKIELNGHVGLVLNEAIDLRLFLNQWKLGFAVREETDKGLRRSLHIFDAHGTAVHKIYAEADGVAGTFDQLVARLAAPDQSPRQFVTPPDAPTPEKPDREIDAAGLRKSWLAMKDTHEFQVMLFKLKLPRVQALRLAGADLAYPVATDALKSVLNQASASELPIMIFVNSPGVVQIHSGPVRTIKEMGPWLNVLDPEFNLHVLNDGLAQAWIVRKPTSDGIVTSLELFDAKGDTTALLFGLRKPGKPESLDWRKLAESLPPARSAA